ncbi:MAG: hypothetical protein ACRCX7_11285 [Cetobacterium sp.]|uniref:hypothetical protein n=1 Tax=Cetobacterium sp. TaxID=2071632 RepID=UPI003F4174D4
MKSKKCVIRTLAGAYVSGWGTLTSNRKEALVFDSFRRAISVMIGFDNADVANNMYFEPIEEADINE